MPTCKRQKRFVEDTPKLGEWDPEELLIMARTNFRCLAADKLVFADIEENSPNPALAALAHKAQLGHVSAFVSHSWHDNAESKWAALQTWRNKYKTRTGKEPTLWFDKYCIDQGSIAESLACLPVYLAGTQYQSQSNTNHCFTSVVF